jgi:hypothetical protein
MNDEQVGLRTPRKIFQVNEWVGLVLMGLGTLHDYIHTY